MNTASVKIYISLLLLGLVIVIGSLWFAHPVSAGNATITLRNPLCVTGATGANCVDSVDKLITKILKFITEVVGALAVLMLVVAGIFFVLAGANPENVNKAKHIALYAVIGLAIAVAANGLIQVVRSVITGS